MDKNLGNIFDAVERALPGDALAWAHGERQMGWGVMSARTNRLARAFLAAAPIRAKVAHYMRNGPAYMEAAIATFKSRQVLVNVNYRYQPSEVAYILDNSDAEILVYDAAFRDHVEAIRGELPGVRLFVEVGDAGNTPDFAVLYENLAMQGDGSPLAIERSDDDLFFLYTGGTTGMPKGVMWPHGELREAQLRGQRLLGTARETIAELAAEVADIGPTAPYIPACPLMHGTGFFTAIGAMMTGSALVTLTGEHFDPHELFAAIDRYKVGTVAIVGDAFARPMLRALDERPGAYDLSSIQTIVSSGVMWSVETKRGMLRHMPQAVLTDSFGSSEAVGFGTSMMTSDGEVGTAKFAIGDRCKVFDENDEEVQPGSGKRGIIGIASPIPLGYYKDPEKTARTFRTIGGVRYAVPGDMCTVEADGSLTLIGRGSATINTAGEKVFPEEVENALKEHPSVEDALVFGLPDEKWGQAVTAMVHLRPGAGFDEAGLKDHVHALLAGYKVPKRIIDGHGVAMRAPNGKADYATAKAHASRELGVAA